MAHGTPPKDPSQRRRRNKPDEFEPLPAEGNTSPYPPLPDGYEIQLDDDPDIEDGEDESLTVVIPFREETRQWYEAWATSPMATKFIATDWNRLRFVIAPIFDALMRSPGNTKLAAELRLQEEKFGGTAQDRQRLRWRISKAASGEPDAKPSSKSANRRQRLKAVS